MRTSLRLGLLGVLVCACASSIDEIPIDASVRDFGIYSFSEKPSDADARAYGGFRPMNFEPVQRTTEIPCQLGVKFGVFFVAEWDGSIFDYPGLVVRWDHPPLVDPERGVLSSVTEWPMARQMHSAREHPIWGGWELDTASFLREGRWRVSLLRKGGAARLANVHGPGLPVGSNQAVRDRVAAAGCGGAPITGASARSSAGRAVARDSALPM